MCDVCLLNDEEVLEQNEIVDTHGGDYTYRTSYRCASTGIVYAYDKCCGEESSMIILDDGRN